MEEKTMNSSESLALITRMIAETRGKLERGGGTTFLIWGYTSLLVSGLVYALLLCTHNPQVQWLWFLIPVVGALLMFFYERKRVRSVTTQIDRFIQYIWLTIAPICTLLPFVIGNNNILTAEGLVVNIGVILTGAMIAFRPLVVGGIIGVLLAGSLAYIGGAGHILIFAAMFVVTMIIPGHILNYRGRCLKN